MIKASSITVEWDATHKRREAHIVVGAEVIKRPIPDEAVNGGDEAIRRAAVAIAQDEGYEFEAGGVEIALPA